MVPFLLGRRLPLQQEWERRLELHFRTSEALQILHDTWLGDAVLLRGRDCSRVCSGHTLGLLKAAVEVSGRLEVADQDALNVEDGFDKRAFTTPVGSQMNSLSSRPKTLEQVANSRAGRLRMALEDGLADERRIAPLVVVVIAGGFVKIADNVLRVHEDHRMGHGIQDEREQSFPIWFQFTWLLSSFQ